MGVRTADQCPMCGAPIVPRVRRCAHCGMTLVHVQRVAGSIDSKAAPEGDLARLRDFVRTRPEDGEARYMLGMAYLQRGLPVPAREQLREAVRLLPELALAHHNLAQAIFADDTVTLDSDEWAEMERHTALALRLDPELAEARAFHLFFGARKIDQLGQPGESIRAYIRAIDACPDIGTFHNNVGLEFYMLGDYRQAEVGFSQAIAIDPDNPIALSNYAMLCHQLGRNEEGAAHGERGVALLERLSILPHNAALVHANYSLCLFGLGRVDEAIGQIAMSLALHDSPIQRQNLRTYRAAKTGKRKGWIW